MELTRNTLALISEIEEKVNQEISQLNSNFELNKQALIKEFKNEAHEEAAVYIEQELGELKAMVSQSESQAKWKVKKDLFVQRQLLVDGLFDEVSKKLIQYAQSRSYDAWIKESLNERFSLFEGKLQIRFKAMDRPLFERLCANQKNVDLIVDENLHLGGYILSHLDSNTEIDLSLDYRLRLQREWFSTHSGLDF